MKIPRCPDWLDWAASLGLVLCLTFIEWPATVRAGQGDRSAPPVESEAPLTREVKGLLSALTLDEKLSLVYGASDPVSVGNVGYLPGVPRLGIPPRRDADALGIEVIADATALPARLGLGASFDRRAVHAAGELIGNEGRALGVDLVYGPQVDLTRLPNWIRNNTTFGEDPFLTGQLAIEEVSGIQGRGLMSEVKHFAMYNGQTGAALGTPAEPMLPTIIDDQTAHELYLKVYEYPLIDAKPSSIMASYQGFQIVPLQSCAAWATDNPLTLTTILRGQWGFTGFVLSDYGATHDVHALLTGLDQEYPGTALGGQLPSFFADHLKALVDPSSTTYDRLYALRLDEAVAYVLYAYQRFGLLGGASAEGPIANYFPIPRPNINQIKDADAAVTEQLSEAAAVLLKNDGGILPLKASDLSGVAIIGPTGRQVIVSGGQGERARGFPDRDAISPLQVLQARAPKGARFVYAPGIDWIGSVVPAENLSPGLTRTENVSRTMRVDPTIDYGYSSSEGLKPGVKYTWTGKLTVPAADTYYLWIQQSWLDARFGWQASVTVKIDGVTQPLFRPGVPVSTYPQNIVPAHGTNQGVALSLDAGSHTIAITAAIPVNGAAPINLFVPVPVAQPVTFRFAWSRLTDSINAAVSAAKSSKIAIVFADDNGESNADLVNSLAPNQDRLIEAVAKANPNTIVVLSTGDPVLMPWLDEVKGVLEMWYPGQEGGTSAAKLLLGEANPSGRLPISWPANGNQTPLAGHQERTNGDGKNIRFSEGIYMGYRWYDEQKINPRFAFGYGLSYTSFAYSDLKIQPDRDGLEVSFAVQNIGKIRGSEVPQVYIGTPAEKPPNIQFAPQKLVGFTRLELKAGDREWVTLQVSNRELSYWSTQTQNWILPTGERDVFVGASSRDIRLRGRCRVEEK